LIEGVGKDGQIGVDLKDAVMAELRHQFRPEFLNRVDDIVIFKPLTEAEIGQIVELMTGELRTRLHDRGIQLSCTATALQHITQSGYDPVFGARPLKRFIQHTVESQIARAIIAGDIGEGAVITIDVEADELVVNQSGQGTDQRGLAA
jgi:ATP-dependent Clp protease ATP-binding subunit ClpB